MLDIQLLRKELPTVVAALKRRHFDFDRMMEAKVAIDLATLGEFGRTIGADRAYVVLDEKPIRAHTWSEDGKAFPPGWPGQALTLPGQLGAA